jgi:TonB family protein
MRCRDGLISLAAVLAASAPPAEAAQGPEPWAKVGEWKISALRAGYCLAERAYPGGTQVSISRQQGGAVGLSIDNRDWLERTAHYYKISLVQDGSARSFAGGAKPEFRTLNLVARSAGADLLAQLAGGGFLEIAAPDGRLVERLDLSGVAPALAKLAPCLSQATLENYPPVPPPPPPPPPRDIGARPPHQLTPPHLLFSNADYPPSAFRSGEEGIVAFRADIGADGRVTGCTITGSSGSSALDLATCRVVRMRSRFLPARDRDGRPAKGRFDGRIAWRLPAPDPAPPPP